MIHILHYHNKSEHKYLNNILQCIHINAGKHQIDTKEDKEIKISDDG